MSGDSGSKPLVEYLLETSDAGRDGVFLSRLNKAANLRKQVEALLEEWVEMMAEARMAAWMREYRRVLLEWNPNGENRSGMVASEEALDPVPGQLARKPARFKVANRRAVDVE